MPVDDAAEEPIRIAKVAAATVDTAVVAVVFELTVARPLTPADTAPIAEPAAPTVLNVTTPFTINPRPGAAKAVVPRARVAVANATPFSNMSTTKLDAVSVLITDPAANISKVSPAAGEFAGIVYVTTVAAVFVNAVSATNSDGIDTGLVTFVNATSALVSVTAPVLVLTEVTPVFVTVNDGYVPVTEIPVPFVSVTV